MSAESDGAVWGEQDAPAVLVLEDGRAFDGLACGAPGRRVGELVFNTSMTGYQEIMTDPSYAGQLITFTTAHLGNYGVNLQDMESRQVHASGVIMRSLTRAPSSWRADASLEGWMREHDVVGIWDVDTRAITRHVRERGVMKAIIAHGHTSADAAMLLDELRQAPDYGTTDLTREVAVEAPMTARLRDGRVVLEAFEAPQVSPHVVVLDFGVKHSILRALLERGCAVSLISGHAPLDAVEALRPDGVLVSNGPGDPARLDHVLDSLRGLAHTRPTFGICLGHQLLARAFGAETFKLRFGHRGPNQPVKATDAPRVSMTSQNHGYAVRAESMPEAIAVTHVNLNDQTVAGMRHRELPVWAVQHHPEAGPGPHDAAEFFDQFLEHVRAHDLADTPAT